MDKGKTGPWWRYHPGWLALCGIFSLFIALTIWATWSSGGVAIPGLTGILFFTVTGRQLWLRSQGNPYQQTER